MLTKLDSSLALVDERENQKVYMKPTWVTFALQVIPVVETVVKVNVVAVVERPCSM